LQQLADCAVRQLLWVLAVLARVAACLFVLQCQQFLLLWPAVLPAGPAAAAPARPLTASTNMTAQEHPEDSQQRPAVDRQPLAFETEENSFESEENSFAPFSHLQVV
jgi:hypothetical protein